MNDQHTYRVKRVRDGRVVRERSYTEQELIDTFGRAALRYSVIQPEGPDEQIMITPVPTGEHGLEKRHPGG